MLHFIKNLEFFRSCLITPQERPHNHRIATDNSSIYNTLLILNMFTRFLNIHPASRASFCFLGEEEKRRLCLRETLEIAAARTSGLVNLVLSRRTGLFECAHPFIDQPMVITKPTVASAWSLGLGSKIYPGNKQRMLNKDLTRFMQSLSRVAKIK